MVKDQNTTIENLQQDLTEVCKHYDKDQQTLRDQLEAVQDQVELLLVSPRQFLVDITYNHTKHVILQQQIALPSRDHLPKVETNQ